MARAAYHLAMLAKNVTADVVEVQEFPELAQKYTVRAVPKTVINDRHELLGSVPLGNLLAAVEQSNAAPPDAAT